MHPHVRADREGKCPTCGMTLVEFATATSGKNGLHVATVPRSIRAGGPVTLRLFVEQPASRVIVRQFEDVHERPFHLFVVSWDLEHFSHLHPTLQDDGAVEVATMLPRPGGYQVYADFLPVGGFPQLLQRAVFTSAFTPVPGGLPRSRSLVESREGSDQGLRVRIEPGRLVAGRMEVVACAIEDTTTGAPVADLEPYLGAWGHAFIVSSDLIDAIHSHPVTPLTSPGGPRIFFSQRFPRPGYYRMWVQVQRRGAVATIPFTLFVEAP
jgi:hypothetical protein